MMFKLFTKFLIFPYFFFFFVKKKISKKIKRVWYKMKIKTLIINKLFYLVIT